MSAADPLTDDLLERVLERLGFSQAPVIELAGLEQIYAAWCRSVPFDNVRKLIHLHNRDTAALAGDNATEFFEAWLRHGTGGTCWPGHGALHSLLSALGFDADRGIGTMMASADPPPGHGTVIVRFDDNRYMVDASILHGSPLRLDEQVVTGVSHPAWGVSCEMRDGRWHVFWLPLHRPAGFDCRLEYFGATREDFRKRHELTRTWSPFNYSVTLRRNRGDAVVGTVYGQRVEIHPDGRITTVELTREEQLRLLVDELGISEELAFALPQDAPTPPPPATRR
jgi:N-hydroxyarylamine O-acetyltransferase